MNKPIAVKHKAAFSETELQQVSQENPLGEKSASEQAIISGG